MHSVNCLKLKRTATPYWSGETVPENMEFMQENEDFQAGLLTHTCLQLDILVHGKPLLAKPPKIRVFDLLQLLPSFYMLWGVFPSLLIMMAY